MEQLSQISAFFSSTDSDLMNYFKCLLIISLFCFLFGLIFRGVGGKRSELNHAVCSAVGILMIYLVSVGLFLIFQGNLRYVTSLPLVEATQESLTVFRFRGYGVFEICRRLVPLITLAFLVNLLDVLIPRGKKFFTWLLFRCLSVVAGILLNLLITWAMETYLPGFVNTFALSIVVILILLLLAVSVFKLIVGVILGATLGPLVGAFYTFFFSNIVGKQISKAALTTLLICGIALIMDHFAVSVFAFSAIALTGLLPAIALLIVIWYVIYHFL